MTEEHRPAATVAWVLLCGGSTHCVKATKVKPPKPAKAHYTGGYTNKECTVASASHEGEYEKRLDLSGEQEKTLTALLEHAKVENKGDPVPYVVFSGANVQIESGAGSQNAPVNGEGNLIVGYNEGGGTQTGSNNLILGNDQSFTSYGSILGGEANTDSVAGGVAFGYDKKANGTAYAGSVHGGEFNTTSGYLPVVGGGEENKASGQEAVVSGGAFNTASGRVRWWAREWGTGRRRLHRDPRRQRKQDHESARRSVVGDYGRSVEHGRQPRRRDTRRPTPHDERAIRRNPVTGRWRRFRRPVDGPPGPPRAGVGPMGALRPRPAGILTAVLPTD